MDDCETNGSRQPVVVIPHVYVSCYSKMNADKRVESPNPILPLSTPDIEAEKLIKTKDEEVSVKNTTLWLCDIPQMLNNTLQWVLYKQDTDVNWWPICVIM